MNKNRIENADSKKEKDILPWNPKYTFVGTAWHYARYRPSYPDQIIELLRQKFKLNKKSRVLDLGCGTGQIALKIAPFIFEVVAIDPQEDMLIQGKSLASTRGIDNIEWLIGESANINSLSKGFGKIDLTTIARAFHWMNRERVLHELYRIINKGGGVAVIGDSQIRGKPKLLWKEVVDKTIKNWLGEERKAGKNETYSHPTKFHEVVLQESEFCDFEIVDIQSERKWSVDKIIGYLYSTSYCSLPILGDKKEPFEADLRKKLIELDPSDQFGEPVTFQIMMVWRK